MWVESCKISNFRNFEELNLSFAPGVNILYGINGSGKTNLLEALFILCLGRSQRGANDKVILSYSEAVYRLEGVVSTNDESFEVAVAFEKNNRKKVTIDKVTSKLSELYENFCAVSAGPEDSRIITGGPADRRLFMDIYLSQLSPRYLDNLGKYQKVLNQKNAALKNSMDPSPFNTLLVKYGSELICARNDFVGSIGQLSSNFYKSIADQNSFKLTYAPSIGSLESDASNESVAVQFEEKLDRYQERERVMYSSLVGPHRDDINIEIGQHAARHHGSQGEVRTAAISLKLSVYQLLKEKRNTSPILLLDEIFAELDRNRVQGLINAFGEFEQLFLTTALEPPAVLREKSRNYRIDNGTVVEIN